MMRPSRGTLRRSFERRGYQVRVAASPAELDTLLADATPSHAVVDLKLGTASGLPCVATLHAHDPATLIVVLTGYASIATAVEAIKLGACQYLVKPSNTDDIEAAFGQGCRRSRSAPQRARFLAEDARVGNDQPDSGRDRLQHLRNRTPAGHASPDTRAEARKAPAEVTV